MFTPPNFAVTICGLQELPIHRDAGFDHILSLIDPQQPDPADVFAAYAPHHRLLLRFHDSVLQHADQAMPDTVLPDLSIVQAILEFGQRLAAQNARRVLVHCHAGVSRSTAAAAILLAQHRPGLEVEAFAQVRAVRPRSWPNSRLITMADAALAREGRLIAAMREHHAIVSKADDDLVQLIRTVGRGHEIAPA